MCKPALRGVSSAMARREEKRKPLDPRLVAEWHPTKNEELLPSDVSAGSHRKVWWICSKGHEWDTSPKERSAGRGCPYCSGKRVGHDNSLAAVNPKLAEDWHQKFNGDLKPRDVPPFSRKVVWWSCLRGHEWRAKISSRSRGTACPFCGSRKVGSDNNLAIVSPDIAKQWHPTKNRTLRPEDVLPKSNKKVWWICEKGHEWKAAIESRTDGRGCPTCANYRRSLSKRAKSFEQSVAFSHPDLCKEWDFNKNEPLRPEVFTAGSHKKVYWICQRGHSWLAQIKARVKGTGCPDCKFGWKTSLREIALYCELKAIFPGTLWRETIHGRECDVYIPQHTIAIEVDGRIYHEHKEEDDWDKKQHLESAGVILYRVRDKGLEKSSDKDIIVGVREPHTSVVQKLLTAILRYEKLPQDERNDVEFYLKQNRLLGTEEYNEICSRLPAPEFEESLAFLFPEISKQWNDQRNGHLRPAMFSPGSNQKVWWKCERGHEWEATIANRTLAGSGCPICIGRQVGPDNNLAVQKPELAKEWHPTRNGNLKPTDVTPGSHEKVWWICSKGHEWRTKVQARNRGSDCPYCSGRKAGFDNTLEMQRPDLARQWCQEKNGDLKPSDVTPGSNKRVWWKCARGHEWYAQINSRAGNGRGCPVCAGKKAGVEYNLAVTFPDLVHEWHPTRNGDLTPYMVTYGSKRKVWWLCQRGHEWQATPNSRTCGSGCPSCWSLKRSKKSA